MQTVLFIKEITCFLTRIIPATAVENLVAFQKGQTV